LCLIARCFGGVKQRVRRLKELAALEPAGGKRMIDDRRFREKIAAVVAREDMTDMARILLRAPRDLARFIAPKGSVTLDGVSLTVNTVEDTAFSVLIIPHTLNVTTLSGWRAGGEVNIEVDLMARYAARLTEVKV